MADCCLIKKVATVEVYENKNEVRAYGFMAGDRNTPVMEVRFKHLWGESNLSSCKLRWIIVDDVGSLLVGEVPIQSDNTALINLPNELFTGDRRMKVQLTVASCDGERILNLQQFTDLKVINSLAPNEVVEPVYQILINQLYDETQKYLSQLDTLYTSQYGSLENLYVGARASLEEYLITADNGGNAEFLQGYSPAHFQKVENTISDLIASTKYKVGDIVEVLGYYVKGDGAGHLRQKKPVGYNEADAVIGADGSIWGIVHNGEVNVSWFGAKGDGVTDDYNYIIKAIKFAKNFVVYNKNNEGGALEPLSRWAILDFGGLCYGTTKTITIENSISIKNGGLIALNGFVGSTLLQTDGNEYSGFAKDIRLDVNDLEIRGFNIINPFCYVVENINVLHHGDTAYYVEGGHELKLSNFNSVGSVKSTKVYSFLHIKGSDSFYNNGTSRYTPIGVFVDEGGNNDFVNIHPWGLYKEDDGFSRRQRFNFYINGINNKFINCYADSPSKKDYTKGWDEDVSGFKNGGIAFYVSEFSYKNSFISCRTFINSLAYETSGITERNCIKSFYIGNYDNTILDYNRNDGTWWENELIECSSTGVYERLYTYNSSKISNLKLNNQNYTVRTNSGAISENGFFSVGAIAIGENTYKFNYRQTLVGSNFGYPVITLSASKEHLKYIKSIGVSSVGLDGFEVTFTSEVTFPENVFSLFYNVISLDSEQKYISISTTKKDFTPDVTKIYIKSLDTPYYTRKMEDEGIYEDYIAYRDELHEYENSQTTDDTMLLPVLQEPIIPKSVELFAKKYNLM